MLAITDNLNHEVADLARILYQNLGMTPSIDRINRMTMSRIMANKGSIG